jgi:hypothetical protein
VVLYYSFLSKVYGESRSDTIVEGKSPRVTCGLILHISLVKFMASQVGEAGLSKMLTNTLQGNSDPEHISAKRHGAKHGG